MKKTFLTNLKRATNGWIEHNEAGEYIIHSTPNLIVEEFNSTLLRSSIFDSIAVGNDAILELSLYDNSIEDKTLEELREEVIEKAEPYNPFRNQPKEEEEDFKLSVTLQNAYSTEELKKVNWEEFIVNSNLSYKEMAELTGETESTVYQMFYSIKKGRNKLNFNSTRIRLTLLHKYVNLIQGRKVSLSSEISEMKEKLSEITSKIVSLVEMEGNYVRKKLLSPLLKELTELQK